jgi:hypothetical protein
LVIIFDFVARFLCVSSNGTILQLQEHDGKEGFDGLMTGMSQETTRLTLFGLLQDPLHFLN